MRQGSAVVIFWRQTASPFHQPPRPSTNSSPRWWPTPPNPSSPT